MTWYRVGPAGIPGSLKTDMDAVLNKKFGTSTTYAPNTWPDNVNLLGPLPEKTASGAIANITDGADGVPLKNWLVTLPASLDGYTEVNVTKAGKNFINIDDIEPFNFNVSVSRNGSEVTVTNNNSYNVQFYNGVAISLKAGNYAISVKNNVSANMAIYAYVNGAWSWKASGITSGNRTGTFTLTEDAIVRPSITVVSNSSVTIDEAMISYGSTATAYEAYEAPTQYTAELGRTIYGGTADIVSGEGEDENGNAFTFTPITAETALGVNNFWADEGDSDVTYRADIQLALNA